MNSQSTRWVDKLTNQKLLLNTQMIIMEEACAFRRFYQIALISMVLGLHCRETVFAQDFYVCRYLSVNKLILCNSITCVLILKFSETDLSFCIPTRSKLIKAER